MVKGEEWRVKGEEWRGEDGGWRQRINVEKWSVLDEGSIVNVDIISLEGNSVADPGGGGQFLVFCLKNW